VVQAIAMILVAATVLASMGADIAQRLFDPRARDRR
jgi:ABC-type dipeptide/oligopeptide/nickel transport system permease component